MSDDLSRALLEIRSVVEEAVRPLRAERAALAVRIDAVEESLEKKLDALAAQVASLSDKFDGMPHRVTALEETRKDHESRLRKLESMVWKAVGAGLAAGGGGTLLAQVLMGGGLHRVDGAHRARRVGLGRLNRERLKGYERILESAAVGPGLSRARLRDADALVAGAGEGRRQNEGQRALRVRGVRRRGLAVPRLGPPGGPVARHYGPVPSRRA